MFESWARERCRTALETLACVDHDELLTMRAMAKAWDAEEPNIERWRGHKRETLLLLLDIADLEQEVRDAYAAEHVSLKPWTDVTAYIHRIFAVDVSSRVCQR